jgi:membrane protein implicated in regulation of membrane protease activity
MNDPENWRWVWLLVVAVFSVGEIVVAGSFFFLPFAAGALAATIAAFSGGSIALQWLLFVIISAAASASLIPLRRHLDRGGPQDGIGARRLIGQLAEVLDDIPVGPSATGTVRLGREEWRAKSLDQTHIVAGSIVKVVDVRGTSVVVQLDSSQLPNSGGASS